MDYIDYGQINQYKEQLVLIKNLIKVITSSLNIDKVHEGLAKKVIDVIEGNKLHFFALSAEIDLAWELGEHIPLEGDSHCLGSST